MSCRVPGLWVNFGRPSAGRRYIGTRYSLDALARLLDYSQRLLAGLGLFSLDGVVNETAAHLQVLRATGLLTRLKRSRACRRSCYGLLDALDALIGLGLVQQTLDPCRAALRAVGDRAGVRCLARISMQRIVPPAS
jgi:hypothetical protein